jgi:putative transposase
MCSGLISLLSTVRVSLRRRRKLQIEILALRHQINVLRRSVPGRSRLRTSDRLLWVWLSRIWSDRRSALHIVKPETVIAWHRKGFRLFWTWKNTQGYRGRPRTSREVRELIGTMSKTNPLWGAPRVHGEWLKLGIDISQATVAKYMVRQAKPTSQTWRTFLKNHSREFVSIDFFTVPTVAFRLLYGFLVLAHDRRKVVHFNVTAQPSAEWVCPQLVNAFPYDTTPRYLLRDRDALFGDWVPRQLMDIANRPPATELIEKISSHGVFSRHSRAEVRPFKTTVFSGE